MPKVREEDWAGLGAWIPSLPRPGHFHGLEELPQVPAQHEIPQRERGCSPRAGTQKSATHCWAQNSCWKEPSLHGEGRKPLSGLGGQWLQKKCRFTSAGSKSRSLYWAVFTAEVF